MLLEQSTDSEGFAHGIVKDEDDQIWIKLWHEDLPWPFVSVLTMPQWLSLTGFDCKRELLISMRQGLYTLNGVLRIHGAWTERADKTSQWLNMRPGWDPTIPTEQESSDK